jgi:hypothetical protein
MRLFFQIMLLSQLTPQCRYPHAEQHVKLRSISRYPLVITIAILDPSIAERRFRARDLAFAL